MKDDPTVKVGSDDMIRVESYVSNMDESPYVRLVWGTMEGKLTPSEARMHALRILEAAEAAESDSLVFRWLKSKVNITGFGERLKVLRDFRQMRVKSAREGGRTDDL